MLDTFKFPKSNTDVSIVRKADIIACIDDNIIDKDVALAVINQCEIDISRFANDGRWTGIPYIGNIRPNKLAYSTKDKETNELITAARENLPKEKYVLFRRQLGQDTAKRIRDKRYFNYIVAISANKNRKKYMKLIKSKGEPFAKLNAFFTYNIELANSDDLINEEFNF